MKKYGGSQTLKIHLPHDPQAIFACIPEGRGIIIGVIYIPLFVTVLFMRAQKSNSWSSHLLFFIHFLFPNSCFVLILSIASLCLLFCCLAFLIYHVNWNLRLLICDCFFFHKVIVCTTKCSFLKRFYLCIWKIKRDTERERLRSSIC